MMELPPKINKRALANAIIGKGYAEVGRIIDSINEEYLYWDKVKYKKPLPYGFTPEMLWSYVKASRLKGQIAAWRKYGIKLTVTNYMQRLCHEFDMNFGSFWDAETAPQKSEKLIIKQVL